RRRLRLNGRAEPTAEGFDLVTREVFGNCPKYIQARSDDEDSPRDAKPTVDRATTLNRSQRDWIVAADTFFIASRHAEAGAGVSHRGGNPGFIRVLDAERVAWPDYSGNRMF